MWITPGRPFWAGTKAFAANMTALGVLEAVRIPQAEMMFDWGAAISASLFVALVVYADAKLAELNGEVK